MAQIRKYKSAGKFIIDGTEYSASDKDFINQFISFGKQNGGEASVYSDILSALNDGKTITYDSMNRTLSGVENFSGLNERQNNKIDKDITGLQRVTAGIQPSDVSRHREQIYNLGNFQYTKPAEPVKEKTKFNSSGKINYIQGDDKKWNYVDSSSNQNVITSLDTLQKIASGELNKDDYEFSGFNADHLSAWYNNGNQDVISGLKERILSANLSDEDIAVLKDWSITNNITKDPKPNVVAKGSDSGISINGNQLSPEQIAWNNKMQTDLSLKGGNGYIFLQGENGETLVTTANGGNVREIINEGSDLYNTKYANGVIWDGILHSSDDLKNNESLASLINTNYISHYNNNDFASAENWARLNNVLTNGASRSFMHVNENGEYSNQDDFMTDVWFPQYNSIAPFVMRKNTDDPIQWNNFSNLDVGSFDGRKINSITHLVNDNDGFEFMEYTDPNGIRNQWGYTEVKTIASKDGNTYDVSVNEDGTWFIPSLNKSFTMSDALSRKSPTEVNGWKRDGDIYIGPTVSDDNTSLQITRTLDGDFFIGQQKVDKSFSDQFLKDLYNGVNFDTAYIDKVTSQGGFFSPVKRYQLGSKLDSASQYKYSENENINKGSVRDVEQSATISEVMDGELTGSDKAQLAALGMELGGLVASFTGVGAPVAAATGVGGTLTQFGADVSRDGLDWGDTKDLLIGLGLDLATVIPIGGTAAKSAKVLKAVRRAKGLLFTAMAGLGIDSGVGALNNILDPDKETTIDDWKNLMYGIQGVISGKKALEGRMGKTKAQSKSDIIDQRKAGRASKEVSNEVEARIKSKLIDDPEFANKYGESFSSKPQETITEILNDPTFGSQFKAGWSKKAGDWVSKVTAPVRNKVSDQVVGSVKSKGKRDMTTDEINSSNKPEWYKKWQRSVVEKRATENAYAETGNAYMKDGVDLSKVQRNHPAVPFAVKYGNFNDITFNRQFADYTSRNNAIKSNRFTDGWNIFKSVKMKDGGILKFNQGSLFPKLNFNVDWTDVLAGWDFAQGNRHRKDALNTRIDAINAKGNLSAPTEIYTNFNPYGVYDAYNEKSVTESQYKPVTSDSVLNMAGEMMSKNQANTTRLQGRLATSDLWNKHFQQNSALSRQYANMRTDIVNKNTMQANNDMQAIAALKEQESAAQSKSISNLLYRYSDKFAKKQAKEDAFNHEYLSYAASKAIDDYKNTYNAAYEADTSTDKGSRDSWLAMRPDARKISDDIHQIQLGYLSRLHGANYNSPDHLKQYAMMKKGGKTPSRSLSVSEKLFIQSNADVQRALSKLSDQIIKLIIE